MIAVLEMESKKTFSFRREAAGFLTHEGFKTGNHIDSTVHSCARLMWTHMAGNVHFGDDFSRPP